MIARKRKEIMIKNINRMIRKRDMMVIITEGRRKTKTERKTETNIEKTETRIGIAARTETDTAAGTKTDIAVKTKIERGAAKVTEKSTTLVEKKISTAETEIENTPALTRQRERVPVTTGAKLQIPRDRVLPRKLLPPPLRIRQGGKTPRPDCP